jgi:hypothetical protein
MTLGRLTLGSSLLLLLFLYCISIEIPKWSLRQNRGEHLVLARIEAGMELELDQSMREITVRLGLNLRNVSVD